MDEKETYNDIAAEMVNSKITVYKNLLILGSMQVLAWAAISPTAALGTTTAGKTLGNITFMLNNIFSCLFTFFTISMLDKETNKKVVILFGNACIIGFTACNWYISYYTLIPGTLLFGLGHSTLWMASTMYMKKLSVNYSKKYNFNEQYTTSFFTGIIMGFSLVGYVVGNATTSGVLTLLKEVDSNNDTTNLSNNSVNHTDAKECHTNDDKLEFNLVTMNVLRGLIVCYSILGFIVILFFLDSLEKRNVQKAFHLKLFMVKVVGSTWFNAVSMVKLLEKMELTLSCPLFIASGASLSFVYTIYTKTYVAECVGVHIVGYTLMLFGLGNSLGSFISGKILSLGIKTHLVVATLALHLATMIFLIFWERKPVLPVILFIVFLWGLCDGSWLTVCSSFAITWCKEEKTTHSFAVYRIVYLFSIGSSALFSLAVPVAINLIILCAMLLIFVPLHLVLTYCHDPRPYTFNEVPIYFIDE